MAIQSNFTWRGVTVQNAYTRVDTITGGKRFGKVIPGMPTEPVWQAEAGVYADSAQETPLLTVTVRVPWTGEDSPYPALYAALKQMPEFSGATDC